jgi:hypothetical protein
MAVGDIIKNPLEMLAKAGMVIDADGNAVPLRALIGIDANTGLPVIVTVKGGKVQCDLSGEGLATQTTLAALLAKIIAAPATEALQTAGNVLLTAIGAGIPQTQRARLSAAWSAHRSNISLPDKLALAAKPTMADVATGGALAANTNHYSAVSAGNSFGPSGASTVSDVVKTASDGNATHCYDVTVAQLTGAEYYDIFCSIDAAPRWCGRVTEAQRAAGAKITPVGTIESPSAGVAGGVVRVAAISTTLDQTTTTRFLAANSNAYVTGAVPVIDCSTHRKHFIHVTITRSGVQPGSAPTCSIIPILTSKESPAAVYVAAPLPMSILSAAGTPLKQEIEFDLQGAAGVQYLLNQTNCNISLWVEAI